MLGPKASSVVESGEEDGWTPTPGYVRDMGPGGKAQVVVSVPVTQLAAVHADLVKVLGSPLGVLYRQVVDRQDPQPQGAPPRDFVALDVPADQLLSALTRHGSLLYHDARCELWLRGPMGDQIILDTDGLIFCQPDDPAFEDVFVAHGLSAEVSETIADRDYVKHWFHADNDAVELGLFASLQLTQVAHRG